MTNPTHAPGLGEPSEQPRKDPRLDPRTRADPAEGADQLGAESQDRRNAAAEGGAPERAPTPNERKG